MATKAKKTTSRFLLIHGNINDVFNSMKEAESYIRKEEICKGTILEFVKAWEIYTPEEPDPEILETELSDLDL